MLVAASILVVVAAWPGLEISLARHALVAGRSIASLDIARMIARIAPPLLLVLAVLGLLFGATARNLSRPRRAALVGLLVGAFALGPGLLVNGILKAQSHRPRPHQTMEVADGDLPYRPFYSFDGGCLRNCSFSSGEAAAAFWTVTPALLAPPGLQLPAVALALCFGVATSALRLLMGAHFLSDVAFSALAMLLLAVAAFRLLARFAERDFPSPTRK